MRIRRFFYFIVLLLSLSIAVTAQTSATESATEKEKAQKELEKRALEMLDQAVSDAASLKLPRNRAIVYAVAADLFWKFDEKRARALFRNSANDILVSNLEAEKDKKADDDPYAGVFEFDDVRNEILPLIAKHDADLALELLVQTRSAKLSEALAQAAKPNTKQDSGFYNFNPDQYRVRQEIALEQRSAYPLEYYSVFIYHRI